MAILFLLGEFDPTAGHDVVVGAGDVSWPAADRHRHVARVDGGKEGPRGLEVVNLKSNIRCDPGWLDGGEVYERIRR